MSPQREGLGWFGVVSPASAPGAKKGMGGGGPEVAFRGRAPRTGGQSRGRAAPAAPSLGFPKGELGLNNESI